MNHSSEFPNFGQSKKEGRQAEARRPRIDQMLNVAHETARVKTKRVDDMSVTSGDLAIDKDTEFRRLKAWLDGMLERGRREVVTEAVTLSPALAKLFMSRNEGNRAISEVNLDRMKRDITDGRWSNNGESLIISKDGMLNDGQHRCRAVIETEQSIRVVVVFGVERASRFTVDQGVVRQVGHYLGMRGYSDANVLASAAGYCWMHKELGRIASDGHSRPTKSQTLLMVEANQDILESTTFVSRNKVNNICSKSILGFAHWAIARASTPQAADGFFDKLIGGAGLEEGSPVLYCRNRLIAMRGASNGFINEKVELIFRAWNFYRTGQTVERINISGKKLPKLES